MDIEGYAAGQVIATIATSDNLVAHIQLRDKYPIWDGDVLVYTDGKNHPNEALLGRIPVQIKGQLRKYFPGQIKYPISVENLQHFKKDGGAIFFLVLIRQVRKKINHKIFYAKLLPYTIQKLVDQYRGQKEISCDFREFPDNQNGMWRLFKDMLNDIEKQLSIATKDIPSMDDLQEAGVDINKRFIDFTAIAGENPFLHFFTDSTYAYVKDKLGNLYPVDEIAPSDEITRTIQGDVSCDGVTYYNHHKCLIKRDEICEFYGKSIQIKSTSSSSTITITPQGTIREALNDINFFLAISSGKEMVVNETPREIDFNTLKEADKQELLRERKQFEDTIEALAMLGADDNIEISSLSEEDKLTLSIIVHAFKNNCVVNLTPANRKIGLHTLKIGQQNILVMAAATNIEGKYRLYNITKTNLHPSLEIDGKTKRVSQFYLLDVEHWRSTTNLDYDFILATVKDEFGCSDDYISDVNMMVLNMLTAYDSQENQNAALLNTVIGITEFMKNQSCDRDGLVIYTLNYLQAIKRKQELSPDEKSGLLEILDSSESTVIKVAANILLERFDKAKILFEQLSEEEQLSITAYPIAKLWDNAPFKTIDE